MMSPEILALLRLFHVVATFLMAAPFYMLLVVNERARFTVPPGYNPDRYLENIIKGQPLRCYAYMAVIAVTGFFLAFGVGFSADLFLSSWVLWVKVGGFIILVLLLSYVHFGIQPKIEKLMSPLKPGESLAESDRPVLMALRMRRKKLAATCLFLVLTTVIFGMRMLAEYNIILLLAFLVFAALFAWRAYRKPVPYGWF